MHDHTRQLDRIEFKLDWLVRAMQQIAAAGKDETKLAVLNEKLRESHDELLTALESVKPV